MTPCCQVRGSHLLPTGSSLLDVVAKESQASLKLSTVIASLPMERMPAGAISSSGPSLRWRDDQSEQRAGIGSNSTSCTSADFLASSKVLATTGFSLRSQIPTPSAIVPLPSRFVFNQKSVQTL